MIIVQCNNVIEEVHALGSVFPCGCCFKSWFSLQIQRCLSSGDTPAVTKAPVASKALAKVLSAVPHSECKENSFSSSPDFSEPEQPADKDSCSSQPNTLASGTATGKIQHCRILGVCYDWKMIEISLVVFFCWVNAKQIFQSGLCILVCKQNYFPLVISV